MNAWSIGIVGVTFTASCFFTWLIRRWASAHGVVDDPNVDPDRKRHHGPTPLLGGVAIIISSILGWWILLASRQLGTPEFPLSFVIGLTAAAVVLAISAGDDRWRWPARLQLVWPIAAAVIIILSGIGVGFITNPFGGLLYLQQGTLSLGMIGRHGLEFVWWADVFTFLWLMGTTYTTKILDGLDGLVAGLGAVGASIIFLLTLRPEVNQPEVGLVALTLLGACLGFLMFNWHPASIFLGESGSVFIGFMLGVLAIISGGKIATALLVLGLPVLDLAWVIFQRAIILRRSPFSTADRRHLHFRLLEAGFSVPQAVSILLGVTAVFGLSTLYFTGPAKLFALLSVGLVLLFLVVWVNRRIRARQKSTEPLG